MPSPASVANLKRRQILSGLMKLLVFIAFIFISVPFVSSLSSGSKENKKQLTTRWVATVPVAGLTAGEVNTLSWAGGVIWVYSRTEKDIKTLLALNEEKLRDAYSDKSEQPNNMNNSFRSIDQKYFVFIPLENVRGCQVSLNDDRNAEAIFTEPCYRAKFDAAGRVFKTGGHKAQKNLPVPDHIIEDGKLKVGIWTPKVNQVQVN